MQFIKKRINGATFSHQEEMALLKIFESLFNTQNLVSPGLAISATASAFQFGATTYLNAGQLYQKAAVAVQALPAAIAWPGTAGTYNAVGVIVSLDALGNVYVNQSNITASTASQAASLNGIAWPWIPETQTVIGALVIGTSTAATAFAGGTTALNAAGIATTYINVTGPFFPAQL